MSSGTRRCVACYCACNPSGYRAWIVSWAHGRRRTLGSVEHQSLNQARDVARKVVSEFVHSGLPNIAKRTPSRITLQTFLNDHYARWAITELKGGRDSLRRLQQAFAGLMSSPITEIDAKAIEQWWAGRLGDKVRPGCSATISKATATRNLATLRSALAKAVQWGYLDQNPVALARLKTAKSQSVVRFLSAVPEPYRLSPVRRAYPAQPGRAYQTKT